MRLHVRKSKYAWTFIITLLIIQKKAGKNMFHALSPSFTGKNSRWQPASVDVASLCDVIIKGDKSSEGNMQKDKYMQWWWVGVVSEGSGSRA